MKTTVTFSAVGAPSVPRGMMLVMQDGTRYIVKRQTGSTLTLVPMRWWHRVPWPWVAAFVVGVAAGQLLWRFL